MNQPGSAVPRFSVNFPELLERVENDQELLRELIGIFREEFPRLLQSLQEAVAQEDMKQVQATGHALKGMLLNLCVTRAGRAASRLERVGRENEKPGLKEALAVFQHEVAGLMAELDAYIEENRQ